MSWKDILKSVELDASQACWEILKREFLDYLETYKKVSTAQLTRVGNMSKRNFDNFLAHIIRKGKFDSAEDRRNFEKIFIPFDACYQSVLRDKGLLKGGDNFKREKSEGLHGWFSRRGGKESKGGKTQGGWIACGTCGDKGGPKPCGRADASKGTKRRCRPTCAACKTYKRRKGSP